MGEDAFEGKREEERNRTVTEKKGIRPVNAKSKFWRIVLAATTIVAGSLWGVVQPPREAEAQGGDGSMWCELDASTWVYRVPSYDAIDPIEPATTPRVGVLDSQSVRGWVKIAPNQWIPTTATGRCWVESSLPPEAEVIASREPEALVPISTPTPWQQAGVSFPCTRIVGVALTVGVHMVGPRHIEGEVLALYDPSYVVWPDHILRELQNWGYASPSVFIAELTACLGAAKFSHHQYQWSWPDWLKPKPNDRWGEGHGQKGYDGPRYWEQYVIVPNAVPARIPVFTSPSPYQTGPTALEVHMQEQLEYLANNPDVCWRFNFIMASGVVSVGLAYFVGPTLILAVPAALTAVPSDLVFQALQQAPVVP